MQIKDSEIESYRISDSISSSSFGSSLSVSIRSASEARRQRDKQKAFASNFWLKDLDASICVVLVQKESLARLLERSESVSSSV